MKFSKIPFPKASFKKFLTVMCGIGLTVSLILVLFQPFGTASFTHEYKFLLLLGYGLCILISGVVYYWIVELLLSQRIKDRWTIIHEVAFLFFNVIACLLLCYVYFQVSFDYKFNVSRFIYFLLYAGSVALFPVSVYLLIIYILFRDSHHNYVLKNKGVSSDLIRIKGTNKNEQLTLSSDNLLFVKSNDNYVTMFVLNKGELNKIMIRSTLSNALNQLSDEFLKCHRSYVVNLKKIKSLTGNISNTRLHFDGTDIKIPVSRKFVSTIRELV